VINKPTRCFQKMIWKICNVIIITTILDIEMKKNKNLPDFYLLLMSPFIYFYFIFHWTILTILKLCLLISESLETKYTDNYNCPCHFSLYEGRSGELIVMEIVIELIHRLIYNAHVKWPARDYITRTFKGYL
jgi:hypothetical protein